MADEDRYQRRYKAYLVPNTIGNAVTYLLNSRCQWNCSEDISGGFNLFECSTSPMLLSLNLVCRRTDLHSWGTYIITLAARKRQRLPVERRSY